MPTPDPVAAALAEYKLRGNHAAPALVTALKGLVAELATVTADRDVQAATAATFARHLDHAGLIDAHGNYAAESPTPIGLPGESERD